ncbi:TPA: pilus assembly protein [Yersinia enterocolitica]|uniref:CS1 type fimbrial major subunit n=1 Tax=Yersinia TaxID=629 RepID=UPI0005E76031|nr:MULTISPECIES: CS1 type fimbrial major subunit [Yersinia]AKF40010.1 pilus assembly protein [Yersinia enterocolitica]ALG43417.1 pilus assembly protein [Yersinia enterocolitica]EKN3343745.1 pilus assembly protein [Yersinia enterocolitica]EKN3394194.1 pilus assembly protein [Yersinia enterocolitica]EKN3439414.1 pilus assembly protein [Yersinia enterocolitica]
MKKTLLSIMTMAALASSTVVCAVPMHKDIPITAEIHSSISVTKNGGDQLNNIELAYDSIANDGTFEYTEDITIQSNSGSKVRIKLREPLTIENDQGALKGFDDIIVRIGGTELATVDKTFLLNGHNQTNNKLVIRAKKPGDAVSGEIYTGTLALAIEDDI